MTKVYIASKFENVEPVRALRDRLRIIGVTITYDWTTHFDGPEKNNGDETGAAKLDYAGVLDCNFFVLICHPNMKGAFFEFGAAYSTNRKCIIVNRNPTAENVFFHLPGVMHVETVDQAFEYINNAHKNPDFFPSDA